MLNISEQKTYRISLHHLGFRPFFMLAGIFAVFSMSVWMWLYQGNGVLPTADSLSSITWHAHEMIYGYSLAVVAGFLLTAIRNWTGVQTLHGIPLLLLALLWLLARIMPLLDHPSSLYLMAVFDLMFNVGLCIATLYPVIKVKQWSQMGVWSKVLLLLLTNMLFYLGLFGQLEPGVTWGLYGGLYLVLSMVLLMGRRVIPFFIEKGVDENVSLVNRRWVDISSLVLMLVFILAEVFLPFPRLAMLVALLLSVVHGYRLIGWHTSGIWRKPLLWILYVAYGWIVLGFALKGAMLFVPIHTMLVVHAFAVGGIGLVTLGMMARVALGHTGRNVFEPPSVLTAVFLVLVIGSLARVLLPMIAPAGYTLWMGITQACWILGFALFSLIYTPMLIKPRVDGSYG
jgi:uncharacterized protein involved in response to NO